MEWTVNREEYGDKLVYPWLKTRESIKNIQLLEELADDERVHQFAGLTLRHELFRNFRVSFQDLEKVWSVSVDQVVP